MLFVDTRFPQPYHLVPIIVVVEYHDALRHESASIYAAYVTADALDPSEIRYHVSAFVSGDFFPYLFHTRIHQWPVAVTHRLLAIRST